MIDSRLAPWLPQWEAVVEVDQVWAGSGFSYSLLRSDFDGCGAFFKLRFPTSHQFLFVSNTEPRSLGAFTSKCHGNLDLRAAGLMISKPGASKKPVPIAVLLLIPAFFALVLFVLRRLVTRQS